MSNHRPLVLAAVLLVSLFLFGCLTFKSETAGNTTTVEVNVNASAIPSELAFPTVVPYGAYNGTSDNRTNKPELTPPLPPGTVVECVSDLDCAQAGCSGELCVAKKNAGQTVSACIYKAEYACTKAGGVQCGCVQGTCAFKPEDVYAQCVKDKRAGA